MAALIAFLTRMWTLFTRYNTFFAEGIKNTLIIAFFSVLLGTVFGTLMAMLRMSKVKPLRYLATAYIEFIRGTPLMVQLMFIFYGLPMTGIKLPDISWIPNFSRFAAGIVAMSMNSCAYVAEIIRSGIQAVDHGQTEAARSLGFRQSQTMTMVVLPQAVKNILPALCNEFISTVKGTSLASVFFVGELMTSFKTVQSATFLALQSLTIVGIIYFLLNFILSRLLRVIERRLTVSD